VLALDPDGGHKRSFARGLRNCSGLTIRPGSDELWCVVNERDMLGDNLPPTMLRTSRRAASMAGPGITSARIPIRDTLASVPISLRKSRRQTF